MASYGLRLGSPALAAYPDTAYGNSPRSDDKFRSPAGIFSSKAQLVYMPGLLRLEHDFAARYAQDDFT